MSASTQPGEILIEGNDSYEQLSELNDMKQHADKIIQGIKKLDDKDANRAIWELFQNAVDLSDECEVTVQVTEDTFWFTHNGKPFTAMTLDCLFKQVSSKTLEEKKFEYEDEDPIGQYGTGFITTHSFGKELHIDGALIKGNGYILINDFFIDRNTDNWKELGRRISGLKKQVSSLLTGIEKIIEPQPLTTFKYSTNSRQNKENAEKALQSIALILPYVMTLNPKLRKVTVINKERKQEVYQYVDTATVENLSYTEITINQKAQKIYFIESAEKKIKIILPLKDQHSVISLPEKLPRLFLYYPLIGTEKFGANFLINSRHFQPTEPRDGLHLASDNEDNQVEEAANQALLGIASQMIFDFVKENAAILSDPFRLARINFNTASGDEYQDNYFQGLKETWISQFKHFPIVETTEGNITPQEAIFWSEELLQDTDSFEAISFLINKYYPESPKSHLVKDWTKIIVEWDLQEIRQITLTDLTNKIQIDATLNEIGNNEYLKTFYQYLINQGHSGLFGTTKLLPNIKGEFRLLANLNESVSLPQVLIIIADMVMPEVPKRHIHPDFKFDLELTPYVRKNYEADINQVAIAFNDNQKGKDLDPAVLEKLIDYCKITASADVNNTPNKLAKLMAFYYGFGEGSVVILPIKDDELDLRTPQKRLIRLFLNDLSSEPADWVAAKMPFLKEVIQLGAPYDGYKDLFLTLPIFPNLLDELCPQGMLQINGAIPDRIMELYDNIVKPSLPVRATLVNPLFNSHISNQEPLTPKNMAERIEEVLSGDGQYSDISDHPFKREILEIIQKISGDGWGKWFQLLSARRANVMLEMVEDEDIKNDVFSIVSLEPGQINLLGNLARNPNLNEILRLGQEALLRQQQENANFQHKYAIGTHIEKILREHMTTILPERIQAEVLNVQDGQDIVITIDKKPVYFVEVKSRWDKNSSVRMSRNQTIMAYEKQDQYALCSVDMTTYEGPDRYQLEDIEKIRDFIKFNNDIGINVAHLQATLNQTNEADLIHLDGEFRTVIPQTFIEKGQSLEKFEEELVVRLMKLIK